MACHHPKQVGAMVRLAGLVLVALAGLAAAQDKDVGQSPLSAVVSVVSPGGVFGSGACQACACRCMTSQLLSAQARTDSI